MYAFLALFVVLLVLYTAINLTERQDGFEGQVPLMTDSQIKIPGGIPTPVTLRPGTSDGVKPADLPGPLPTAPYQQIARNSPYPYQNPALQRTTRQRILNSLQNLQGFLGFQAQELDNNADPNIQLPLQMARSDFKRLNAEANVLQRNPGLPPQLTELDIAQMNDNLAYLQREAELIGVNRPFQSPAHDIDLEGFRSNEGFESHAGTLNPRSNDIRRLNEGFEDQQPLPPMATESQQPASEQDLQAFSSRIQGEVMRLSASGTTDPVVQARVGNLTKMKTGIDEIVQQLQTGAMLPLEVPIMSSEIQNALPILSKVSEPLPQLLNRLQLPAGLANMLPSSVTRDPATTRQIGTLLNRYAQSFLEGASASMSFNVDYTPPSMRQGGSSDSDNSSGGYSSSNGSNGSKSTVADTGFPSASDLDQVADDPSLTSIQAPRATTDPYAADPRAEGRTPPAGPGSFDWKTRARQITAQIKRRGMDPTDFGALYEEDLLRTAPPDFSWKGYTQMICTRLRTVDMDKMDEMCGCPPSAWKGWNA